MNFDKILQKPFLISVFVFNIILFGVIVFLLGYGRQGQRCGADD